MRYALGTVLSLPLSLMLIGLLAAALPMPWQEWLVLQLIAAVLLWMLLVLLVVVSMVLLLQSVQQLMLIEVVKQIRCYWTSLIYKKR